MKKIKLGDFADWSSVKNGTTMEFYAPRNRHITFEVIGDGTEIQLVRDEKEKNGIPIATVDGQTKIEISAVACYVRFVGRDCLFRGKYRDQTLPPSGEESFTRIEPIARKSPEVQAIERAMFANQKRNEQQMLAMMELVREARSSAAPSEPKALPKAEETPPQKEVIEETEETPPSSE